MVDPLLYVDTWQLPHGIDPRVEYTLPCVSIHVTRQPLYRVFSVPHGRIKRRRAMPHMAGSLPCPLFFRVPTFDRQSDRVDQRPWARCVTQTLSCVHVYLALLFLPCV
jgi:hypothetical protein